MNIFTAREVKKDFPDAKERTYAAGQVVFYHGDTPDYVMIIKSGAAKFYDIDSEGNEKILHIGGEGSVCPLFYSFEKKERVDGYYSTICETKVLLVSLASFQNKLKTSPDYAFKTLQWYAAEMDHIILRLKSMEKSTAKQRILQALFYLCDQHSKLSTARGQWYRIKFPMTQQTLADLTGLTRETVNITLRDPDCLQLIRTNKKQMFEIHKEKVAEVIAQ